MYKGEEIYKVEECITGRKCIKGEYIKEEGMYKGGGNV